MTTYSVTGFVLEETANGNITGLRSSTLEIVMKDNIKGITFEVTGTSTDGEPTITWSDSPYNVRIDGKETETAIPEQTNQVLKVSWNGNVSYVANLYDEDRFESYVFCIGGDALPAFNSVAAFNAFMSNASISIPGGGSGFTEGATIMLTDIPDVATRQADKIIGTGGKDNISSGAGKDFVDGKGGSDTLSGGLGNDKLLGGVGADKLLGGAGGDRLIGGGGNDQANGGNGNDWLFGGNGADSLIGGKHADLLDGGKGADVLTGGGGTDKFVFKKGYGQDAIADFRNNADTIVLDDALWGGNLTKRQVLNKYASVDGDDIVLDFGVHELRIEDITNIGALRDDIDIV